MDLISNLAIGFGTALTPENLLYCFMGSLFGTLIGVLPGIGPSAAIAMLLPITFSLPTEAALIMLAGIYYGAQYGGSTTAILVNLPGDSAAAVTTIDGYKMARAGRAGPALAICAIGSFFAGCVATLVIALFAKPLTTLALQFGSPEYFALLLLGLVASVVLARGSPIMGIGMVLVGLLLGLVGSDLYTGRSRFTLGIVQLYDGLDFIALAIGLFGVTEIIRNIEESGKGKTSIVSVGRLMPTREDLRRSFGPIVRGTALGSMLGMLPGGGALLSSFAAYMLEKKISRHAHEFGEGAIEGVAAPESANNAGAQTSFIPMLTLGLPSNPVMALMIGALILQGVSPGPNVATDHPQLFWGIIVSMWLGNAMLIILNLPLIGLWTGLLRIPYYVLFPAILAFSSIGVYAIENSAAAVVQLSFFGLIGYVFAKLDCEPAPMMLGFILGPMLEDHFKRTLLLSRGDPSAFVSSPICVVLLLLSAALLVLITLPSVTRRREEVFSE